VTGVRDQNATVDAWGQVHGRAGASARIVSLVPSITELLFSLGLGPQVVGCTSYCIHPSDALRRVQAVGGTKTVELDRVRDLAPTHAIVNVDENTRETFDSLKTFVPEVVVTHPKGPSDNVGLYRLIGAIFSRETEATRLVARFENALARVTDAVTGMPRRRVLYLIWRRPWMTVSPDTYIARMLAVAGWTTVPRETTARYPVVDGSDMEALDIDLCLLSSEPYPFRDTHLQEVRTLVGRAEVRLADGEMLSWYGSRAISGLDYLAQLAHQVRGVPVPAGFDAGLQ
jgi:ABC-type Fe3+-hydroxamate transport system substrate-binding protein